VEKATTGSSCCPPGPAMLPAVRSISGHVSQPRGAAAAAAVIAWPCCSVVAAGWDTPPCPCACTSSLLSHPCAAAALPSACTSAAGPAGANPGLSSSATPGSTSAGGPSHPLAAAALPSAWITEGRRAPGACPANCPRGSKLPLLNTSTAGKMLSWWSPKCSCTAAAALGRFLWGTLITFTATSCPLCTPAGEGGRKGCDRWVSDVRWHSVTIRLSR
jgi:hypothetical protein